MHARSAPASTEDMKIKHQEMKEKKQKESKTPPPAQRKRGPPYSPRPPGEKDRSRRTDSMAVKYKDLGSLLDAVGRERSEGSGDDEKIVEADADAGPQKTMFSGDKRRVHAEDGTRFFCQAHMARRYVAEEAMKSVLEFIDNSQKEEEKQKPQHTAWAFSCEHENGTVIKKFGDNKRSGAGKNLRKLLDVSGAVNVVVISNVWYTEEIHIADQVEAMNSAVIDLIQRKGVMIEGARSLKGMLLKEEKILRAIYHRLETLSLSDSSLKDAYFSIKGNGVVSVDDMEQQMKDMGIGFSREFTWSNFLTRHGHVAHKQHQDTDTVNLKQYLAYVKQYAIYQLENLVRHWNSVSKRKTGLEVNLQDNFNINKPEIWKAECELQIFRKMLMRGDARYFMTTIQRGEQVRILEERESLYRVETMKEDKEGVLQRGWIQKFDANGCETLSPENDMEVKLLKQYRELMSDLEFQKSLIFHEDVSKFVSMLEEEARIKENRDEIAKSGQEKLLDDLSKKSINPEPHQKQTVRLHLQTVESSDTPEMKMQRQRACSEIRDTENTYISSLKRLVVHYIEPLKQQHVISTADQEKMFRHIKAIINLHNELMIDSCTDDRIYEPFLDTQSMLNIYTDYISSYQGKLDAISTNTNKHKFQTFLIEAMERSGDGIGLGAYLIMPVQRLPRYILLLQRIIDNTPVEQKEMLVNLHTALSNVEVVAEEVNERKRVVDNKLRMLAIKTKLRHYHRGLKDFDFMKKGRTVVHEGVYYQLMLGKSRLRLKSRKKMLLIVLSDTIIWATYPHYSYQGHKPLSVVVPRRMQFSAGAKIKSGKARLEGFELMFGADEFSDSMVFQCDTKTEADTLIRILANLHAKNMATEIAIRSRRLPGLTPTVGHHPLDWAPTSAAAKEAKAKEGDESESGEKNTETEKEEKEALAEQNDSLRDLHMNEEEADKHHHKKNSSLWAGTVLAGFASLMQKPKNAKQQEQAMMNDGSFSPHPKSPKSPRSPRRDLSPTGR